MKSDYIDCPELAGKTIRSLRMFKDTGEGTEIQIDFTDETSFSCLVGSRSVMEASLVRTGVGTPETLHRFDPD